MSEIKYDPDFPYVLVNVNNEEHTRWANKKFADNYLEQEWGGYGRVIDTTPKPKIPEDADYLIWEFEGETNMAYRDGNDWYGSGEWWPTEDLVEALKDAEVTVLVRKEDS